MGATFFPERHPHAAEVSLSLFRFCFQMRRCFCKLMDVTSGRGETSGPELNERKIMGIK